MKNMKKSPANRNNHYRVAESPEVVDMDSLSYFDDESLERRHNHLQSDRDKAAHEGVDLLPWETEICYVQREIKLRSNRRALHEKYLRSNPEYQYYEAENAEVDYDKATN
jgi:uncharacterized protein YggL (DUF469 family)